MTDEYIKQMATMETDISYIKNDVKEIKNALISHVDREMVSNEKYASIKDLEALDQEISEMPRKMQKTYAGIWTEAWIKGTVFAGFIVIVTTILINLLV